MQRYRALGVTAVILLQGLIGCRHIIYTTVSPNALTGGYAKVGDYLAFSTLTPGGPGYTVKFLRGQYPCGDQFKTIPVSPGTPAGCKVLRPTKPQGPNMAYFYAIDWGHAEEMHSLAAHSPAPTSNTAGPHIPYSVVPCRGCDAVIDWNGAAGDTPEIEGGGADQKTPFINCDSGTATVDYVKVNKSGSVLWFENDGFNWAVDFGSTSPTACTNGTVFNSSNGGTPKCTIGTNAGDYTYAVTVDKPGCKAGTGRLTVNAVDNK